MGCKFLNHTAFFVTCLHLLTKKTSPTGFNLATDGNLPSEKYWKEHVSALTSYWTLTDEERSFLFFKHPFREQSVSAASNYWSASGKQTSYMTKMLNIGAKSVKGWRWIFILLVIGKRLRSSKRNGRRGKVGAKLRAEFNRESSAMKLKK